MPADCTPEPALERTRSRLCVRILGLATILCFASGPSVQSSHAQCTELCGDGNSSSSVTSADVIYMVAYLYQEGPAPVEQCGDMDDYELTTTRDLAWVNAFTFGGGAAPICPPANGVYTTIPNAAYLITHTRVFRAGQSVDTLHISLVSSSPTKNMTLPITILVDGAMPGIGVAEVDENDEWWSANVVVAPVGAPSNSV